MKENFPDQINGLSAWKSVELTKDKGWIYNLDDNEKIAVKKVEQILTIYEKKYNILWLEMMKKKLNISNSYENDRNLINELLDLMHVFKLDYTNTFIDIEMNNLDKYDFMKEWFLKFKYRKKLNNKEGNITNINPKIIPRNHNIENILNEVVNGKLDSFKKILPYLNNPYNNNIPEIYKEPPKDDEIVHQTFCGT